MSISLFPGRILFGNKSPLSCLVFCYLLALPLRLVAAEPQEYDFNIPAQSVQSALNELAEQANLLLLFPYDRVLSTESRPLNGVYSVKAGLRILLQGTGLSGDLTKGGVITISRETSNQIGGNRCQSRKIKRVLCGHYGPVCLVRYDNCYAGRRHRHFATGTGRSDRYGAKAL